MGFENTRRDKQVGQQIMVCGMRIWVNYLYYCLSYPNVLNNTSTSKIYLKSKNAKMVKNKLVFFSSLLQNRSEYFQVKVGSRSSQIILIRIQSNNSYPDPVKLF